MVFVACKANTNVGLAAAHRFADDSARFRSLAPNYIVEGSSSR